MASAGRNFKNIFSRPLFTIIFMPEMLKFYPYSILTGVTVQWSYTHCVLKYIWLFSCKYFTVLKKTMYILLILQICWTLMDARPKALSSCLISTQITRLCKNFTEKVMKLESLASPGNKSLNTGLKVRKWSSSIPILCTNKNTIVDYYIWAYQIKWPTEKCAYFYIWIFIIQISHYTLNNFVKRS